MMKMMKKANEKFGTALRTISYVKPHWYLILISTVAGVVKLTLPLLLPEVLKYFTDEVLAPDSILTVPQKMYEVEKWLGILLVLLIFIYIPAAFLREAGSREVSNRIMHTMRCQLFDHLQLMGARFHEKNKSGALVTRMNSDVEKVHDFIWSVVTNIWIDSITLTAYLFLMLRINLLLTVVSFIVLPISVVTTKKIRALVNKSFKQAQSESADAAGYMQERMAGWAVVKLFHREEEEKQRFKKLSTDIYYCFRRGTRFSSLGVAITSSFSEIISAVVICLSALIIIRGQMTIGEMIVFYSYLGYLITPLRRFAELNVTYARCMAGIERVYEILDTKPDIEEREDAVCLTSVSPIDIEFRNVFFKYSGDVQTPNINDVSFSVKEGEKIALVGSSGCGKTTIVNLLARFYEVDEGCILIAGRPIRDYTLFSLYDQMGMVFQDTILFSGTIEENLRYGKPDASREELVAAAKAANAYEFIMKTPDGFNTVLGERGIGLSGGQKQRLAIARVFLKNPRLLILDEATSALDSESEGMVQEALDHLMQNRTSIVIAHRLSTIVNVDKIFVMDKGRIVESGTHSELLHRNGRYTELYQMQFRDVLNNC